MANVMNIQVLNDGQRHCNVKLTGILDTADITATDLIDPAARSAINSNGQLATRVVIDKIAYSVEPGLAVLLYWDATADVLFAALTGEGEIDASKFGGIFNTEAAGVTGKIQYTTQGWSAGAVLSFNIILETRKK